MLYLQLVTSQLTGLDDWHRAALLMYASEPNRRSMIGTYQCVECVRHWHFDVGTWPIGWARLTFSEFSTSSWRTTFGRRFRACGTNCSRSCCRWRRKWKSIATTGLTTRHARQRLWCSTSFVDLIRCFMNSRQTSRRTSSNVHECTTIAAAKALKENEKCQ